MAVVSTFCDPRTREKQFVVFAKTQIVALQVVFGSPNLIFSLDPKDHVVGLRTVRPVVNLDDVIA